MNCIFIDNPASGRGAQRGREDQLRRIVAAFTARGHRVELVRTSAPGSGSALALEAVRGGAEAIFTCGGDGTIHDVIQGLVSETGQPRAALGIIPMGSANALARHLGLSMGPVKAALQQVQCRAQTIPVGKLEAGPLTRYFVVMAGAGPDGALAYQLLASQKSKLGRFAYYLHAARIFATRRFRPFDVRFTEAASGSIISLKAVSAMAVRVGSFGGLFNRLAGPGGSIDDPHLQLLILRPPALLSLPLWFLSGWLNLHRMNPFLQSVQAGDFSCAPGSDYATHFQADGECLGRIPMRVSVIPNALRILLPSQSAFEAYPLD